jgi:hypothetical protein
VKQTSLISQLGKSDKQDAQHRKTTQASVYIEAHQIMPVVIAGDNDFYILIYIIKQLGLTLSVGAN